MYDLLTYNKNIHFYTAQNIYNHMLLLYVLYVCTKCIVYLTASYVSTLINYTQTHYYNITEILYYFYLARVISL